MITLFFTLYFILFESRIFQNKLQSHSRSKFIAISSLIFYATWYPPAVLLLIYHAILGMGGGRKILKNENKTSLFIVILLSLFPLLFFKYFNFFIDMANLKEYKFDLILPLGLSFYTFSMIGYYIDIYNKKIIAKQSFLDLLLFISFWPHLAAGPILRAKNIFSNIFKEEKLTTITVTISISLISIGLMKKLLIADNIGAYVNWNISYGVASMSILDAWATILGFSAQIYADFSGYSDMAIGFALLMGFKLPANFNYPYRATTVTDFWHRWHISLSTWFRDYLYFPLGGSKNGHIRTYFNILVVFILSGIWHGVGIGFAIWGAIHGVILIFEKILGKTYLKIFYPIRWIITFILIVIAWSFFRLDYTDAILLVQKMFGFKDSLFIKEQSPYYIVVILMMLIYPLLDHIFRFYKVDKDGFPILNNSRLSLIILSVLIVLAFTFSGSALPFIYFDF
jgi:alginate O-acetyltransferase complex protein AlgI